MTIVLIYSSKPGERDGCEDQLTNDPQNWMTLLVGSVEVSTHLPPPDRSQGQKGIIIGKNEERPDNLDTVVQIWICHCRLVYG